jgi:adhesin transport system membrane fusion protein
VVSNLEGGIVEAILVRTGQIVRSGAPLVRLDRTQTGAEYGSNSANFEALRMRIARLEAELAGRAPVFPVTGSMGAEQASIERSLYASRMADLNSLLSAASSRVTQAERSVAEAQAALAARRSAQGAAESELNLIRPLVQRGIEPRLSLIQAENAAAVAASEAAAASAAVTRAQSSVVEARSTLAQQRQDWRSKAAQELATAQAEMVALRRTLPALSARVDRTVVRSPLAGRVNRVLVTTVGGTIAPGAPLVEIVPSEESLLVEVQVRPEDIAWVRSDQDAKINITAYDSSIYGSLDGRVVSISPDATVNERTGESFYTVRVNTTDKLVDKAGRELEIGAGMIADVSLLGDKRTVLSYLLTPITRLSETAFREE